MTMQHHVYDISHCLTTGIKVRELTEPVDPQAKKYIVCYRIPGTFRLHECITKNNWFFTKEEAIAAANDKRQRAIKAAERKIAKLQAMTFDCPDLPTTEPPC